MTKKFRSEQHLEEKVTLYATHVSEMITKSDPKYRSPEVQAATKREIEFIVEKATWAVTFRSEMLATANLLNSRFFITIKDIGTRREVYKAHVNGASEHHSQAAIYPTAYRASSHLWLPRLHPRCPTSVTPVG
jgi:hypothetical protein